MNQIMGETPHSLLNVAARCRTLNKKWCSMLKSKLFITENFKANNKRQSNIIVGVGYPPTDLNAQWFCKVDPDTQDQVPWTFPRSISPFGYYTMIGSDNGNICVRVTENGANSRLLVWNPLTQDSKWVDDEVWKRRAFVVCVEAFSYLTDSLQYRIINVFKRAFGQRSLSWSMYDSQVEDWSLESTFEKDVAKLGPQSVVSNGVVFWIGWGGIDYAKPNCVLSFNSNEMEFYDGPIPTKVSTENNSLAKFKDGVGFVTYRDVGLSREVVLWDMYRQGHDTLVWEKMFVVSDFSMPNTPSLLLRSSILSVLECRASSGAANNAERTDLYISIMKHMKVEMELLYHNHWKEDVHIKTITLHSDGLYPIKKDPNESV